MRFIGIDLHNDSFLVVIIDAENNLIEKYVVKIGNRKQFRKFLQSLGKEDYVAFETTTNSFWLYDQIKNLVKAVYIIDTHKFFPNKKMHKKTDFKDGLKMAKELRRFVLFNGDDVDFPTVYVPEKEVQELRSMFSTYNLLTKQKTMAKNRMRSLLIQKGIYIKGTIYTANMRNRILNSSISKSTIAQLQVLYNEIDYIEKELKVLKDEILVQGEYFKKEIDIITSIKGVSVFTAIAIMTDIANIDRFENAKKLCSYLRSAPGIEKSNNTEKMKSVNKQSRKLAITMLMQGIWHTYNSNPYLSSVFFRIKGGKKKSGKARVAVARKIFQGIFNMLKKGEYFYWKDDKNHQKKVRGYENFLKKRQKMKKSA